MDTQVSPAVVVVVLILVAAILLGVYFIVFVPAKPGDVDSATGETMLPPATAPTGMGPLPAAPTSEGQPVKSKAPEAMSNAPKPEKGSVATPAAETNPIPRPATP